MNWPNAFVPNASYKVIIPTSPVYGNFPTVPLGVDAKCLTITLQSGATITINGTLEEME